MLNKLCEKKAELLLKLEAAKLTVNSINAKIEVIDELIEEEREKEVAVAVTAEGEEIILNNEV